MLYNSEVKKMNIEKKYQNLQARYKRLAEKHRSYIRKNCESRKAENKKMQKMQDIITNLISKIYEISPDENLYDIDLEVEKILKNKIDI